MADVAGARNAWSSIDAMEPTSGYRPRVSRETRLLLTAGLLAITVLWLLARVRFRDRPAPPSAIPAVLSQLTATPTLDDVAAEVGELSTRLAPSLRQTGSLPPPNATG